MQNTEKFFTDEMDDLAEHCINLVKQHHGLFMDNARLRIC